MTIRSILAGAVALTALQACSGGLMPSEYAYLKSSPEQIDQWLSECEGNDDDSLRKARNCELASKSMDPSHPDYAFVLAATGEAYQRQRNWPAAEQAFLDSIAAGRGGDIYSNLSYVRLHMGKFDEGRNDLGMAYEETGNLDYLDQISELDYALEAATLYQIDYNGFACRSVQKDSIVNPANEIAIHVVAATSDFAEANQFPMFDESYINVRAGTVVQSTAQAEAATLELQNRGSNTVFELNGRDPFTLSVMMWEVDDGGPAIDVAVMYAGMLGGKAKSSPGSGVQYRGQRVGKLSRDPEGLSPDPDPIHRAVSSALQSVFGTANDYMGGHDFTNMIAADIVRSEPRIESGIPYDFKSTHRQGGADCSVYFVLRPTDYTIAGRYIDVVNEMLDGEPY